MTMHANTRYKVSCKDNPVRQCDNRHSIVNSTSDRVGVNIEQVYKAIQQGESVPRKSKSKRFKNSVGIDTTSLGTRHTIQHSPEVAGVN